MTLGILSFVTLWIRALVALAALSAWLVLLLLGAVPAPLAHLLLVAALGLFPWRLLRDGGDGSDAGEGAGEGADGAASSGRE